MAQNENETGGKKFGGILKYLVKEEFREQDEPKKVSTPAPTENASQKVSGVAPAVSQPIVVATVTKPSIAEDVKEMRKKLFAVIEKLNQPGIDFFEFWNAIEGMGGLNPENVKSTFVILSAGAGGTLTKDLLVSTGNFYIQEITSQIQGEITRKKSEREETVKQQGLEKQTLTKEIAELEKQIASQQQTLEEKKVLAAQVDTKYVAPLFAIDQKIEIGETALTETAHYMQSILSEIQNLT